MNPEQGRELIAECFRVLKPGGVLRIVVPDLEGIARLYLETHNQAWQGDEQSKVNYNWMKLELLDQLVRRSSGGNMGRYMASKEIENSDFVRSRVGDELDLCLASPEVHQRRPDSFFQKLSKATFNFRVNLIRRCIGLLLGGDAKQAFNEGLFRSQGEIHRWMYDRFSLRELASSIGFVQFRVCRGSESQIDEYAKYSLDTIGESIRKPDSIFVECTKPGGSLALSNSRGVHSSREQTACRTAG